MTDRILDLAAEADQLWRYLCPSFSMVLAFRNDALTYTSVPPLSISVEERQNLLDNIQQAHAELLVARKNNL